MHAAAAGADPPVPADERAGFGRLRQLEARRAKKFPPDHGETGRFPNVASMHASAHSSEHAGMMTPFRFQRSQPGG